MSSATLPDLRSHFTELLRSALDVVVPGAAAAIVLERPKSSAHGDFACNVAMQLAKAMKRNPREIAQALIKALPQSAYLEKVEVAGAGFLNFHLKPAARQQVVRTVLTEGEAYGRIGVGQGKKVQIEFVSANPTGPLHVGHGRGAAYGASLGNLLGVAGFAVTREYYVNDAGRQMDILTLSAWLRYLEICGVSIPFPANAYQGDYVRDMAQQIFTAHGTRYLHDTKQVIRDLLPVQANTVLADTAQVDAVQVDAEAHLDTMIANAKQILGVDYAYVHDLVLAEQLGDCRNDLEEFGVVFDNWFSEQSLFESELVSRAVAALDKAGHLYEMDGAKWFRSTSFGDEKDRVVQRENGQYTYFASDIAYHLNKFERGFDLVINVWGADHHGYIARVKGALQALGLDPQRLTIALVQFAVLYRDGKKASMSTRSGEFVTLRELRGEVGNDAARLFYVLRKSDQHLDFDLDLAKSQSTDNPVYYIQYAHARVCSVLEQAQDEVAGLVNADLSLLVEEAETELLRRLSDYPLQIETAARDLAPHQVAFYLKDLAGVFHSYYNATRLLVEDGRLRAARLALAVAVGQVLRNGLAILGVGAPEKM